MHLSYRKSCRACGSPHLTPAVDLGSQYLQGVFLSENGEAFSRRLVPLSLVRCDPSLDENACGLLQAAHSVPPELMYRLYWYRSGTNRTMRNHLGQIAEQAIQMREGEVETVLDIGCNDGTLLGHFSKASLRVGVDPSNSLPVQDASIEYLRDFFPSTELAVRYGQRKFDVICSIAMFYDLEDPKKFVKGVADFLAPDGIWVVEVSYMPKMLEQGSYDSICHEHLEYYSLATLESIFQSAGLQVVRAEMNDMNGGSVRLFVTHNSCFRFKKESELMKLREIRVAEFDLELDTDKPYRKFQDRIELQRDELKVLLRDIKSRGETVHIYGASTKGNTILQWCGIDNRLIDCASERNPDKWGTFTPGTEIPIVSEEASREKNPNYYLVLPWHFKEEFLEREQAALRKGTKFIFPLPEIAIHSL